MRSAYPGSAGPSGVPGRGQRTRRPERTEAAERREGTPRRPRALRPAPADRRGRSTVPRLSRRPRVRRRRFALTGRAVILGLVVCALVLTLAYPLRSFLAQRGEIASFQTAIAATQSRVDGLQNSIRNYRDPQFVESEARRRLQYQYPGDVVYRLPAPPAQPAQRHEGRAPVSTVGDSSWYVRLWDSTVRAGEKGNSAVLQPAPPEPGTGGSAPDGPTQPGSNPQLPDDTG